MGEPRPLEAAASSWPGEVKTGLGKVDRPVAMITDFLETLGQN
jgi:hypothetical protein